MTYREEADALDAEILACIEQRQVPGFDDLALRVFAHQLRYNRPYATYCASLGVTPDRMPPSWETIPPVPASAYKEAALCTFDPSAAKLVFETSGTSTGAGGKHYMESATLYDAALLAGFRDAMLYDAPHRSRFLLFVPNPAERPQSSLGYMMRRVADSCGDGDDCWYLQGDMVDVARFTRDAQAAAIDGVPVCIAGTAFALVQLLDALRNAAVRSLPLPPLSRIMETGGFKGRTRIVKRDDLYAELSSVFSIGEEHIIAEYGMTELTSQYYDAVQSAKTPPGSADTSTIHGASPAQDDMRVKRPPVWMRPRVVGPDGKTLPSGVVGALVHVDLANRSSCVAVQTEDLGVAADAGGIILLGREQGSELRGCSLDAEQLRALQHA